MPDGDATAFAPAPEKPRASRTADSTAAHPDAHLIAAVEAFRTQRIARHAEWDAFNRLPKRHPDYKSCNAAMLAMYSQLRDEEKQIARTPAVTLLGAHAKARLGYFMLTGDDPQFDDLLHEEGSSDCRAWSMALSGTRDIVRLMGGTCGPAWDEPDAALLALRDQAIAADDESLALADQTGDMDPRDPRYDSLMEASRAAFERASAMAEQASDLPALTAVGMRAKVEIALRVMPSDCSDSRPAAERLLREVAGLPAEGAAS